MDRPSPDHEFFSLPSFIKMGLEEANVCNTFSVTYAICLHMTATKTVKKKRVGLKDETCAYKPAQYELPVVGLIQAQIKK